MRAAHLVPSHETQLSSSIMDFFNDARNHLSTQLSKPFDIMAQTTADILNHLNPSFATRTFLLFTSLPYELRAQIWQLALPGPRVIEIRNRAGYFENLHCTQIYSICRIPVLLHTCRESREVALKYYALSFSITNFPPQIYVDFSVDTIYFGPNSDFYNTQNPPVPTRLGVPIPIPQDLDKIRFLAL